jgi:hypothetical protein
MAPKAYDGEMFLGKVVVCLQKTKTKSMFIILCKYQLKWIKDLNIRPETEVSTGKKREYSRSNRYRQGFPQLNVSSSATKRKDGLMGFLKN